MKKNHLRSRFKPIIGILLVLLLAYWQIASLQFSIKWDMLDVVLPWRYFSSECLQNGYFPFWNPYQQMGYPFHADLQYPLWNPEQLFLSLFTVYNNYTIHLLFIAYLSLAAYGMYKLAQDFNTNKTIAFAVGLAYVLSGFFIAHVQSLILVIGATWLPFIIRYYLKMMKELCFKNLFKTALFLFFMFMGGYQALSIILAYFLLIIFIHFVVKELRAKNYKTVYKLVKLNMILGAIAGLSLAVIAVVYFQVSPYLSRFSGMSLESVQFGPLSPQSLISLFIPFTVTKNADFFATDSSMANAYMGMIMLLFLIFSLFIKKKTVEKIFLYFGLFSLLVSMGKYLPFREFLYHYIPLMDIFRFPSIFSLFTILFFLLLSGRSLTVFFNNFEKYRKLVFKIALSFILILSGFLVYSLFHISFNDFSFFKKQDGFFQMIENTSIYEHIFIHSIIQLLFLSSFLFLLFKKSLTQHRLKYTVILLIFEMIIAVQLNIFYTGVSKAKPKDIRKYIAEIPKDFPIPASNDIILDNTDSEASYWPLWRNTNIFRKKVSYEGYSSFWFKNYDYLFDSVPHLKNAVLNNTLLYLSDKIYSQNDLPKTLDPRIDNKNIYVPDSIFNRYKAVDIKYEKTDTVYIVQFSPNEIEAKYEANNPLIITLLQSDYVGWKVYVDDEVVPHFTSNYLFISALVPKGKHKIRFEYSNPKIILGFIISYSTFLFILAVLFWISVKRKNKKQRLLYVLLLFAVIVVIMGKIYSVFSKEIVSRRIDDEKVLFETLNDFEEDYEYWITDSVFYQNKFSNKENKSYLVDSTKEYACVFKATYKDLPIEEYSKISINLKFFLEHTTDANLVLSIENKGENLLWKNAIINDSIYVKDKWHEISLESIAVQYSPDNIISVYIWNNHLNNFFIDDFNVRFIKE